MVEATALLNAAKRLLLAARVGANPAKVNTGTTIIPPPKPIMEPKTPATNPKGINHSSSIIVNLKTNHHSYITKLKLFLIQSFQLCRIYQQILRLLQECIVLDHFRD